MTSAAVLAAARAVVVLVHGLGTTPALWSLPEDAGLADALERADFAVHAIDLPGGDGLASRAARLRAAIETVAAEHPGAPIFGVGHDYGGTALYQVAAALPALRGVVGVGAPVALGGATRALRRALDAPRVLPPAQLDWLHVGDLELVGPSTRHRLARALMTDGLEPRIHQPFLARATRPMDPAWLAALARLHGDDPAPRPGPALEALRARPDLPVLALLSPHDGLAPPWQCDPAALGLRRENIRRLYLGPANGHPRAYAHLDLLLHPQAVAEIQPLIVEWLEVQRIAPGQTPGVGDKQPSGE